MVEWNPLEGGLEGSLYEVVKVKHQLQWKPQDSGDSRTMGCPSMKAAVMKSITFAITGSAPR